VARAETYRHAEFHLDPSNRLATVHQRFGQDRTGQTGQRSDSIGRTVLHTVAQKTKAKDVLPNTHRKEAPEITLASDTMVPSAAPAHCLQRAYTIRTLLGGYQSAKRIFVPGDLDV